MGSEAKPAKADLTGPPAYPVARRCWVKADAARGCFVMSQSWYEARQMGAAILNVEPYEVDVERIEP